MFSQNLMITVWLRSQAKTNWTILHSQLPQTTKLNLERAVMRQTLFFLLIMMDLHGTVSLTDFFFVHFTFGAETLLDVWQESFWTAAASNPQSHTVDGIFQFRGQWKRAGRPLGWFQFGCQSRRVTVQLITTLLTCTASIARLSLLPI